MNDHPPVTLCAHCGQHHTYNAERAKASTPPGAEWFKIGGGCALVDSEDVDWLSKERWRHHDRWYAIANVKLGTGKPRTVTMQQFLLNVPDSGTVDHINRRTWDNRKSNLRPATFSQNAQHAPKRNRSGYRGVEYRPSCSVPYRARIRINGETRTIGCFLEPVAAARAYDQAAFEHYGEFAILNFPEEYTGRE